MSMLEIAAFKSVSLLSAEASPDAAAFPAMCANTPAGFTLTCITGTLCEHPHAAGMGLMHKHHPCGFPVRYLSMLSEVNGLGNG